MNPRVVDTREELSLEEHFSEVRGWSERICDPLETDDYGVQPMTDASPPKWHLAHTSWFFETFLLKPGLEGYSAFHPQFEYLFNSYYNGVGNPYPRPLRGNLSRPTVAEVYDYRAHVDAGMRKLIASADPDVVQRTILGLNHEQQHQELLLTDLKYNLGHNPLRPLYREPVNDADSFVQSVSRVDHTDVDLPGGSSISSTTGGECAFVEYPGGLIEIGVDGDSTGTFFFDNECPRHRVYLEPYALAEKLVSNADYLRFMCDGGYERPELWLSDGWAWLQQSDTNAPEYWYRSEDEWHEYHLTHCGRLQLTAPVTHVSFFEADAYARWAGRRLPSEAEWEAAAGTLSRAEINQGNFAESGELRPVPCEPVTCETAPGEPVAEGTTDGQGEKPMQLFGNTWEWTASPYRPYPGFTPLAGTLGEYNGKFMSNQLVLRGGSCVTARNHIRASYRNFFYPPDRWQFTGIRLAEGIK